MRMCQVGSMFSVLSASWISSTYTDQNSPFCLVVPNLELFPNRVHIELSQIAFSISILPKGDRTDSFREERPDLPWTMILIICALVDVSKYLDILTLEFLMTLMGLPF